MSDNRKLCATPGKYRSNRNAALAPLPASSASKPAPPFVLVPFDRRECLTIAKAAEVVGCTVETIRRWCDQHALGRRVGGRWMVSHPALLMFVENDRAALAAYHQGHRDSPRVAAYFARAFEAAA